MSAIYRDIFKAIHEGKWLSVEYRNKQDQVTRYWIGIKDLHIGTGGQRSSLSVEGLHLGRYTLGDFDRIFIDSILSSQVLDGTYYPVNERLLEDISLNPEKYGQLFEHVANMRVLNYLEDCNRMDTTPYIKDFALIRHLDRESFRGGIYPLSDEQFQGIVKSFQKKARLRAEGTGPQKQDLAVDRLVMNVLSIHTPRGLYVLAYRNLCLDLRQRCLRPDSDITVCTEFTVDGKIESIRKFLDADDYELLWDFRGNQEKIKDAVMRSGNRKNQVDDLPYVIGLRYQFALDLHAEYRAIIKMYRDKEASIPIRAFFGDLVSRPRSSGTFPISLLDKRVNLDQLLAINNAMKYPLTYIQGPPGTGKTNTIINTIITAFFNERTVLFSSYNNHPIDGVVEKLNSIAYGADRLIPFPVIRLGNKDRMKSALARMRYLYEETQNINIFEKSLDRNKEERTLQARKLSQLLKKYDDYLEMQERCDTISRLMENNRENAGGNQAWLLPFDSSLDRQLKSAERMLERIGEITEGDAKELLTDDLLELRKYLYYTSVKYIKKIGEPKNEKLKNILFMEDGEAKVIAFRDYLGEPANIKKFLQIFPIVATTCISAHKLGKPEIYFDMTIIDEASQCNTAVSLVPIIRGKRLMLVGDPQQLNPVILLDEVVNQKLRRKYAVSDEYDYRKNSIYKTFLACDPVSDEVLLRYHYRCHEKIIGFNNKKYYNSKLLIRSQVKEENPLICVEVSDGRTDLKNTAPAEVEDIVNYARRNADKSIGVITPFVNQKNMVERRIKEERIQNVTCGTVHAFQGDEKDVVLFSTVLTDETYGATYEWLKNNKELINVATSRARNKLIVLVNQRNLERLHRPNSEDDLYDLVRYVKSNGVSEVVQKEVHSRALGVKPYSTETEEAFLNTLNHALGNIWVNGERFSVEKEVAVSRVFDQDPDCGSLFYSGKFDFVVYEKESLRKYPVLVIELDGKEHYDNEAVRRRDNEKQKICESYGMELIRVENSYARRYQHIKTILEAYFNHRH